MASSSSRSTTRAPISLRLILIAAVLAYFSLAAAASAGGLAIADVHDLLPLYGLPKGLLPDNVNSYSLSADDGDFEIELDSTCYVHFSKLVYYDKKIKGKLSYGKVSGVSGIQAKKGFLWVSVSGIVAHPSSDTVEFQVGFLSEELPVSEFEKIHTCKDKLTQSI